jgi:hypothetical protein
VETLHQKKMLPRNLPKLGSILVNPTAKFRRIELEIQVHELRFGWQRDQFFIKRQARSL